MSIAGAPFSGGGRGGHPGLRSIGEERPRGAIIDWKVIQRVLAYTRPYAATRNFVFAPTGGPRPAKPPLAYGK